MPRALTVIVLMLIVMAGAMSMLPGCSMAPDIRFADVQPIYEPGTGEARSLVTDPPAVREYAEATGADGYLPWYHDRNDYRMQVQAGYRTPRYQSIYVDTYDRIHSTSRGRVHDHYNQTTRRTQIFEGAR